MWFSTSRRPVGFRLEMTGAGDVFGGYFGGHFEEGGEPVAEEGADGGEAGADHGDTDFDHGPDGGGYIVPFGAVSLGII